MAKSKTNNVYTIPARTPFLARLARFVLEGEATNVARPHDPLEIAKTTIYLPTRRAVRALRLEFANSLGGHASFLPTLKTLGDSHEDELPSIGSVASAPLPQVPTLERQILLARLVRQWVGAMGEQARELFGDEDIVIPSSSAEALWLSSKICELIDQMETEEVSWLALNKLVPQKDQYANWWQLTLDFLQIAMKFWPAHLQQIGASDPASHRRQLLDLRTLLIKENPTQAPIIAAGSTGSIPATARFLKAIKDLPNGAVILPGLDMARDAETWATISGQNPNAEPGGSPKDNPTGCEDHPQYGLGKLLQTLAITRDDVIDLGTPDLPLQHRAKLLGISLLPSSHTHQWQNMISEFSTPDLHQAIENITIINAPAERQEALAIALVLRDQIRDPKTTAALVTPDRNLARRVVGELKRFGLIIDDSGGSNLGSSSNAIFLRLMIGVATRSPDAITLAAFTKHPLLFGDEHNQDAQQISNLFEISLLRDSLTLPRAGKFLSIAKNTHNSSKNSAHLSPLIKNMTGDDWQQLFVFCQKLDEGLKPLLDIGVDNIQLTIGQLFNQVLRVAQNLSRNEAAETLLFQNEAGIEFAQWFEELAGTPADSLTCDSSELLSVYDALIAGRTVRQQGQTHPRIAILGPLEARLQPLDCIILGGLNEGIWPALPDSGPFLSRPMKTAIDLATPERRIGLAAHDFEQLLGYKHVFLTRSNRVDNAPSVPSRWLQRLNVVCGEEITDKLTQRGDQYSNWAHQLDTPATASKRIHRPCPKPAISYRPKGLSITEIETWIRDPYAIYAKRILKLSPTGELGTVSEPALRGNLLHDALAEFVEHSIDPFNPLAAPKLMELLENRMQSANLPSHLSALWRPRFEEIAKAFVEEEKNRHKDIFQSFCEIAGEITIANTGFKLRGRADRIDIMNDGSITIIDYKTGTNPSIPMARTLSPQLALEGAMVRAGGFSDISAKELFSLQYIRLRAGGGFKVDRIEDAEKYMDANSLAKTKLAELEKHILDYNNPDQGYISRFAVELSQNFGGDYDHLARVGEWSWGKDNEGNTDG